MFVFLGNNTEFSILLLGFFTSLFISYNLWKKHGRDGLKKAVVAYTPPEGISASMAAVIHEFFYPRNILNFLNIGIFALVGKGCLTIEPIEKKDILSQQRFLVTPTGNQPSQPLSAEEDVLLKHIKSPSEIGVYSDSWVARNSVFHDALSTLTHERFFIPNVKLWYLGALPFFIAVFYCLWPLDQENIIGFFLSAIISIASFTYVLRFRINSVLAFLQKLFALSIFLSALSFMIFFFFDFTDDLSLVTPILNPLCLPLIISGVITLGIFRVIMQAPLASERHRIEQLLGFKRYLEAVEAPVIDKMAPPEMSRALFEEYLPYALAFGIGNRWIKHYDIAIKGAMLSPASPSFQETAYNQFIHNLSSGLFTNILLSALTQTYTPPSAMGKSLKKTNNR